MLLANHFDVKKIKIKKKIIIKMSASYYKKERKQDSGNLHKKTYNHENHESQYYRQNKQWKNKSVHQTTHWVLI